MFFTRVCDSVHNRGVGSASLHAWIHLPRPEAGIPLEPEACIPPEPEAGIPPEPEAGIPPEPEAGTPLGAYTPTPTAVHAGTYGQQAGGTHPTGMQSCLIKILFYQTRTCRWSYPSFCTALD